jgi:anti-sigma factor RsiW
MTPACPGSLQLHQHLADPARSKLAGHLAGCPHCVQRLAEIQSRFATFDSVVFPRTVDAVVGRAPRQRRPWWVLAAPLPVFALAALVLLAPRHRITEEVAPRGSGLMLSVFVAGPSGIRALKDNDRVPADAALRFEVHPPQTCWLTILSLDATGEVSRLFPLSGDSAQVSGGLLPGGAVLDGTLAPERVFALCGVKQLPVDSIRQELRQHVVAQHPLRTLSLVDSIPSDALQATLFLEKEPKSH